MSMSYRVALEVVQEVAETCAKARHGQIQIVSLPDALGRIAAIDHYSPISTPPHDTSAMDGYAISSEATLNASPETPTTFVVKGTIAAGDKPISLANEFDDGAFPCVEIMTGAQFPHSLSRTPFDACVKIEDTIMLGSSVSEVKSQNRLAVTRPHLLNANRRFAGGDIQEGDVILAKGDVVYSRHVMAMASVGLNKVSVHRKLRVAVWSTGNELSEGSDSVCTDDQILNSNGPYLSAVLREHGADVEYKGILRDDPNSLQAALSSFDGSPWDFGKTPASKLYERHTDFVCLPP